MRKILLILLTMFSLTYSVQANEKVYLHLDQNAYFLGETINFCAYVNDTETNRPTELSKVLYVELLSPEGDVVKNVTCKLDGGKASGCIKADKSLLSGLFELRAYTRYMCNWANNYYSRIIPLFDAADNGDYTKRTMLKRRRNVSIGDAANTTNVKATKVAAKTTPARLSVNAQTKRLKPNEKVILKFHGEPNSTFSLSVRDANSDVAASGKDNIVDGLATSNADEPVAWNDKPMNFVEPEKGITLRGKLMLRRDYLKGTGMGVADTPIKIARKTENWIDTALVNTDNNGMFQVEWGDFYGDSNASIYAKGDNSEQRVVVLDKWFSPKPSNYPNAIYKMWDKAMRGTALPYTNKRIDINEEIEWLIDNDSLVTEDYVDGLAFDDLEGVMLHDHHNLLCNEKDLPYRSLFLDSPYPGDTVVPESRKVSDNYFHIFDKYKTIVIRTDSAICEKYSYANYPSNEQEENRIGLSQEGILASRKGVGTEYKGDTNADRPSMIVCYIPFDSSDDDITYRNKVPRIRHTVIHGFTPTSTSEANDDHRRTLYWNPSVATDENGDATVEFLNNSTCKKFSISAEGLTQDGRPICEK